MQVDVFSMAVALLIWPFMAIIGIGAGLFVTIKAKELIERWRW